MSLLKALASMKTKSYNMPLPLMSEQPLHLRLPFIILLFKELTQEEVPCPGIFHSSVEKSDSKS